jgi:hypothetical protein
VRGRIAHLPAAFAALLALAVLGALAAPADARQTPPRSGSQYAGTTEQRKPLTLAIAGRRVQIVGFSFDCRSAVGTTSLQDIRLRRTSRGYAFSLRGNGVVSFSDERPEQNARVSIYGRFSRSARSASGTLRVSAPRCDTRSLTWSARRRRAS